MVDIGALALGELPAYHALKDPQAPALTVGERTLSYTELENRANGRARQISAFGIGLDDIVTVALPNGIEFYETVFALWKLGATPNIVSPKLPDAELGAIVQLVDPKVVIGSEEIRLPGRQVLRSGQFPSDDLPTDPLPKAIPKYWKAMTSGGSTGRPKIIVDHMPGTWDPNNTNLGQMPGDVILNPGPLYHNAPFIGIFFGLFAGAHVVDMEKFDAEKALALIEQHAVNWVNLVPTMMNRIWRLGPDIRARYDMSSLRAIFHMGAACPIWLKQGWIDWLGPDRIFELYAGTERQGATIITGREWLERKGSVGRLQPGAQMRIINEAGLECSPGQVGEIYFLPESGRNATYHYIGAEPKAVEEWESLGDIGYLDEDGYLYLADRRTDLIISGGANIYPAEIEGAIETHPDVICSAVIGLPDDDLGQRVHAIVQTSEGSALKEPDLLATLAQLLVKYKLPRTFEFTEQSLRDDAGKLRRFALREARMNGANAKGETSNGQA